MYMLILIIKYEAEYSVKTVVVSSDITKLLVKNLN